MKKQALFFLTFVLVLFVGELHLWASGTPDAAENLRNPFNERQVIDAFYRDDPLSVISRTRGSAQMGAASYYLRGETLRSLGLAGRAAESFRMALLNEPGTGGWWNRSLAGYMELIQLIPDLPSPEIRPDKEREISGEAALYFGTYLISKGNVDRGHRILPATHKAGTEEFALSVVTRARHEGSLGQWNRSIKTLESFKGSEPSGLTDLVYLQKGLSYLESGELNRARDSFITIPPKSPFAAEALHGLSWTMIRNGDLVGGAVRLSALMENHGDSPAARKAAIDLALCYRELGLYDRAGKVLSREVKYLKQVSKWTNSLKASDFRPGKDLNVIFAGALSQRTPNPEILSRNPGFVKQWISEIVHDRNLKRYTSLLEGVERLSDAGDKLVSKYNSVILLFEQELEYNRSEQAAAKKIAEDLNDILVRLPALQSNLLRTVNETPLARFADKNILRLANRVNRLDDRMRSVETSTNKAGAFAKVIEQIKNAKPGTEKERQLISIKESAYHKLIGLKPELRTMNDSIDSLEGKIWLSVKKEVADSYNKNRSFIEGKLDLTRASIGKYLKVQELLSRKENSIITSIEEAQKVVEVLESDISQDLASLRSRIITARTQMILNLAHKYAEDLRMGQTRALYTAADIETSHIESNIRAMQEALD